jgi:hypothetical protein
LEMVNIEHTLCAGDLTRSPLLVGAAVILWVAGFEIIYSCVAYQHSLATTVIDLLWHGKS